MTGQCVISAVPDTEDHGVRPHTLCYALWHRAGLCLHHPGLAVFMDKNSVSCAEEIPITVEQYCVVRRTLLH